MRRGARLRTRVVAVLLWSGSALAAHAQTGAEVRGTVFDSLSSRPLAGALVQLAATDSLGSVLATVTSDSAGTFTLQGIARGRYRLGFFHPLLDSLGLTAALRELEVTRDRVSVSLATPSAETIR
ncbi:MAG: carboxypeptidase-like regulatory domain-containing protein, partial [Gemmatimonadaceae bacterium]|nr:carboxypeptidase-like regulatory domain-containing protein [Gemmatimonadaceae bacterium]